MGHQISAAGRTTVVSSGAPLLKRLLIKDVTLLTADHRLLHDDSGNRADKRRRRGRSRSRSSHCSWLRIHAYRSNNKNMEFKFFHLIGLLSELITECSPAYRKDRLQKFNDRVRIILNLLLCPRIKTKLTESRICGKTRCLNKLRIHRLR